VFRSAKYSESLRDRIWRAIGDFIDNLWLQLWRASRDQPVIFWVCVAVVVTLIVMVLVRGSWLARQRAALMANAGVEGKLDADGRSSDAWRMAQQLASRGDFTAAAHEIYRHILMWLAHHERIDLHPSRTVGDYGRELRRRSSSALGGYRAFARSYEVVVYGHGECDNDRYSQLVNLAGAITGAHA
jgi:hypothetical protein